MLGFEGVHFFLVVPAFTYVSTPRPQIRFAVAVASSGGSAEIGRVCFSRVSIVRFTLVPKLMPVHPAISFVF